MDLVKLAQVAFPEAWENNDDGLKARAVSDTARVLTTLRHEYGSGQIDAVVRGLLREWLTSPTASS